MPPPAQIKIDRRGDRMVRNEFEADVDLQRVVGELKNYVNDGKL